MIARSGIPPRESHNSLMGKPEMGEMRVAVRLTNAADARLASRGQIQPSEVRTRVCDAMVETGAVRTIVPRDVVHELGLECVGKKTAEHAGGRRDVVDRTEPLFIEVLGRDTFDEALLLGNEVLIGQTVLEKLDLLVDCANQRLVPNPEHPDEAISKVK